MGLTGARLLKLGFQGFQTEEMVAGGTAGKGLVYDLGEKDGAPEYKTCQCGSVFTLVRVTGMRQSDNRGASNPGLPKVRGSGWDKSDGA